MQLCALLEFLMAPFKNLKSVSQKQSDMNPEEDAFNIWNDAYESGYAKYIKGSKEHKTQFWTAGAGWYASNLKEEQLDLISYLHHLSERIKMMQSLVIMMEEDEISLRDAATILKNLCSDSPPKVLPKQSHD